MRMVFLKHVNFDKINKRISVEELKSLFERKKVIKRIGFDTLLGKILRKKPDDVDLFKHGEDSDGECIFDP